MRLGALAGSNSPFPEQQPSQHMTCRNTWIKIISAPGNVSSHFFLMEIASGHLSHASSNMQMEENLVTNLVKHNVPGHELLPWCKFGDDHQFFLKRQSERILGCEHWTPVFLSLKCCQNLREVPLLWGSFCPCYKSLWPCSLCHLQVPS